MRDLRVSLSKKMVCSERDSDDCMCFLPYFLRKHINLLPQCATKSVILHLQWQEGDDKDKPEPIVPSAPATHSPVSFHNPHNHFTAAGNNTNGTNTQTTLSRTRTVSSLGRSTSAISTPSRKPSLNISQISTQAQTPGITKRRLSTASTAPRTSLNSSGSAPRTPSNTNGPRPVSPLPSPGGPLFPVRFGRAAILTAPPKIVAVVETPDVAVGAVDPRKRRVVTATRFSSRAGADRRVSFSFFYLL
jgi:pyrimidine and pyridine-specific 5'-nucleotidase